jgi:hypothetical protein
MKKINFVILLMTIACIYCSASGNYNNNCRSEKYIYNLLIRPAGDGLSYATAVVITDTTESAGVDAEYKWIKAHYPGYVFKNQGLMMNNNKPYDIMDIQLADGSELKLYFNISNYFGKL